VTRTEIIANRAVEEDLLERLRELGVPPAYTKFPAVHGAGSSGERHGDHVWPEENAVLLFYTSAETGRAIANAVRAVKRQFPSTGVKLFQFEVDALEL
jgi:hypothetical protein